MPRASNARPWSPEDDEVNELHEAASSGSTALTLAALSTGSCDIDGGKFSPLMIAACHGYPGVTRVLLDRGADVSKRGDNGATALHGAAQGGFTAVAKLLVDAGAEIDIKTISNGSTPLHMAASRGHAEVMGLLLAAGADPNSRRHNGATPLNRAAEGGRADAVELLLRANVDPLLDADDQEGHRFCPLEVAAALGHSHVVLQLIQHFGVEGCGGPSGGGLLDALEVAADVMITAMLTDAGVVDTASAALIFAARKGRAAITAFLLRQPKGSARRRRAYVNARCKHGTETALLASVCSASVKIARSLVDAGADTAAAGMAELDGGTGGSRRVVAVVEQRVFCLSPCCSCCRGLERDSACCSDADPDGDDDDVEGEGAKTQGAIGCPVPELGQALTGHRNRLALYDLVVDAPGHIPRAGPAALKLEDVWLRENEDRWSGEAGEGGEGEGDCGSVRAMLDLCAGLQSLQKVTRHALRLPRTTRLANSVVEVFRGLLLKYRAALSASSLFTGFLRKIPWGRGVEGVVLALHLQMKDDACATQGRAEVPDAEAPAATPVPWYNRTYKSKYATLSAFSVLTFNAVLSVLAGNAFGSVLSLNSILSAGSVNSILSVASTNCILCVACSGKIMCMGN
eukprot:g6759.t1